MGRAIADPAPERCLTGQWAVVTGASEGIGLGIAEAFARAGAGVVLVARRQERLDAARLQIEQVAPGAEVRTLCADASSVTEIDNAFSALDTQLPFLNVFVANAGRG